MENQQTGKRISFWGWVVIVLFTIMVFGSLMGNHQQQQTTNENQEQQQIKEQAEIEDFHNKGEKLNQETGDLFLKIDNLFVKSHLENVGNKFINLELTVSDSW